MSESRPIGRPTKYDPAYCDEVISAGEQGLSLTAFAGLIGVARSTINEWIGNFPDFSEAVKRHQAKRTLFLERGLLAAESGPSVTTRIFALKNAAPEEWKDKVQNEHTGADGGPIQTEATVIDAASMTSEERATMRAILVAAQARKTGG